VLLAASFARPVLLPKLESFRDLFDLPFVFTYEPENIDDMATRMVELGHLSEAELDVISQAALNWAKVRDWQTISNQLDKYLGEIKHARNSVDVHICEGGIDHQIQVYDQETNGQLYDIALCVVNYRSIGDLRKLQRSLQRNVKVRWRMLILDNSEQDTEFKQLKRDFPDAVLVKPEENLGYAAGNNVLMALAKNAGFPVIGILNPDVYLEKDCVSAMVEAVQGAPRSLHSPVVTKKRKDGSPAISFFTSCISSDKGALALSHPLTGRHVGALSDQIQESDSLCGCSMFFSPAILDKYGYMPEEYFLYFEETAWTYAIKQQGGKLIAHPNARIVHTKASQKKGLPALPYIYYMVRNSLIFAQRFGFDVKQTERKYKETFIKHWQVQVDSAAPEYGMFFKRLCEIAQEDGKKGITGKVDIAQRLESAGRKGFRKSVGFLESMDSHTINGWVGEKNWLFATLPSLLVFMDGQYAGSFTPDIEREDIKNLGYKLKSGFQFQHKRHAGFYDTRVDIFNARTGRPLTHIEQTDN
jgi:GT2 family glycosyltransferase